MSKIASNSKSFCEVCCHSVYDMDKHIKTEEHYRNVRRANGYVLRKPQLPIGVNRVAMKSLNIILFLVIIAGCIAVGYGLPREPRIVKETVTNAIYLPFKATPPINLEHMEIKLANQAKALDLATEEYITLQKEYKLLQADLERIKAELEQAKRYGGLVEFRSELELMQWLQQNPVSEREYVKYSYVCSDFARDLVLDAISEGFLMGLSRISDEMHQKAFTIIGKEIYEIEAITDGVRLAGRVH